MSRMRLMQAEGTGASALVCLYCGAESDSEPPYEVMRCDCRSADAVRGGPSSRRGALAPPVRHAG